MGIFFPAAVP